MTRSSGTSGGGGGGGGTTTMSETAAKRYVMPTPAYMAPAGASLGQNANAPAESLVSGGNGNIINTTTGAERGAMTGLPITRSAAPAQSLITPNPGGGFGNVATEVSQRGTPAPAAPAKGGDAPLTPVGSTVDSGPARSPALTTNFLSIVGGAGGLGRRTNNSKRTLIGGA